MRRLAFFAAVSALAMCLAGCPQHGCPPPDITCASEDPPVSSVSGQVLSSDGVTPPPCAVIVLEPADGPVRTAVPDPQGLFSFEQVCSGQYRIAAYAPGFRTQFVPRFVSQNDFVDVTFLLSEETAALLVTGQVRDDGNGDVIAGAHVRIFDGDLLLAEAYTCALGAFAAPIPADITAALIRIEASAQGFCEVVSIDVAPATATDIPIFLSRLPRNPYSFMLCGANAAEQGTNHLANGLTLLGMALTLCLAAWRRKPRGACTAPPPLGL